MFFNQENKPRSLSRSRNRSNMRGRLLFPGISESGRGPVRPLAPCDGHGLTRGSSRAPGGLRRASGFPTIWTIMVTDWDPGSLSSSPRPSCREGFAFSLPQDHRRQCAPRTPHLPPLVSEELPGVLDDLLVRKLGVGLLPAEGERLPQRHPKRPRVTRGREFALVQEREEKIAIAHAQPRQVRFPGSGARLPPPPRVRNAGTAKVHVQL